MLIISVFSLLVEIGLIGWTVTWLTKRLYFWVLNRVLGKTIWDLLDWPYNKILFWKSKILAYDRRREQLNRMKIQASVYYYLENYDNRHPAT